MDIPTVTAMDVKRALPSRDVLSRKGQNGKALIVGGSRIYHGAPVLAALAALRSGTDLVYVAVPKPNVSPIRALSADLIVIPTQDQKLTRGAALKLAGTVPKGLGSAAIGMGLDTTDGLPILVQKLLDMDIRLVLDAGALRRDIQVLLSDKNCIITPHPGEFYRVFGTKPPGDVRERALMVKAKAAEYGVTILLKGPTDVISNGTSVYLNAGSVPAMSVGGTGDVLAGLAAGILSRTRNPMDAAVSAAYINKQAGLHLQNTTGCHMLASDMPGVIPQIMKPLEDSQNTQLS